MVAKRYRRELDTAERDAEITRYWTPDRTCAEVAAHFGINKSIVSRARQRAIAAAVIPAGREALQAELVELEKLIFEGWRVLHAKHYVVSDGRVVTDPETGEPLIDTKPVLMAMDRLLRCRERWARLNGLDAPTKAEVRVTDDLTAEIEALAAELAGADRRAASRSEESTSGPAGS